MMATYSLTIDDILDMTLFQIDAIIDRAGKRLGIKGGVRDSTKDFIPNKKQQDSQDKALNERLKWLQKQRQSGLKAT